MTPQSDKNVQDKGGSQTPFWEVCPSWGLPPPSFFHPPPPSRPLTHSLQWASFLPNTVWLELFLHFRVFLNLWFAKPMVCVRVIFHENDGNHENDENDEDNSDSYKEGVECWIRGKSRKPRKWRKPTQSGCKPRVPQTTGLQIPDI